MLCAKCNSELPEEASFCPYCMTQLGDVIDYSSNYKKERKIKSKLIILGFLVLGVIIFVLGKNQDSDTTKNKDEEPTVSVDTNKNTVDKEIDAKNDWEFVPELYCGTWYNEDFSGESPELEGGMVLNIISVNQDKIIFDLFSYQKPPQSRIAQIYNVEANIVERTAEFVFRDDGWGNGGLGIITFLEDSVCISIKLTTVNSDSLWGMAVDKEFKKISDTYENDSVDFYGLLGQNYVLVKDKLQGIGCELVKGAFEGAYDYEGISIFTKEDKITSIYVDYTMLPIGFRDSLNFSTKINGNVEYDYIKLRFGEPVLVNNYGGVYISTFDISQDGQDMEALLDVGYMDGEVFYIKYYDGANTL